MRLDLSQKCPKGLNIVCIITMCMYVYVYNIPLYTVTKKIAKHAGWESTMLVKDGEASKWHPKTP